jgi:hypothetical protein
MIAFFYSLKHKIMEKEFNKREYNLLCANFLEWEQRATFDTKENIWRFNWVDKEGVKHNNLAFDSDWNWIMKVIEKMEKLSSKTIFEITMEGAFKISRYKIEFIFQPNADSLLHLKLVNLPQDDYKNPFCKHHIVQHFDFANKGRKAAVIHAIWLFLNWYNENK